MNPIDNDAIIGAMQEDRLKDIIENFFNVRLTKTINNHPMDFMDEDGNYYEIKSRRNRKDFYNTTMVSENKIKFAKHHSDVKHYFIFAFDDGDYYWQYNTDCLLFFGTGGRTDRGMDEIRNYCYIPVQHLQLLLAS